MIMSGRGTGPRPHLLNSLERMTPAAAAHVGRQLLAVVVVLSFGGDAASIAHAAVVRSPDGRIAGVARRAGTNPPRLRRALGSAEEAPSSSTSAGTLDYHGGPVL